MITFAPVSPTWHTKIDISHISVRIEKHFHFIIRNVIILQSDNISLSLIIPIQKPAYALYGLLIHRMSAYEFFQRTICIVSLIIEINIRLNPVKINGSQLDRIVMSEIASSIIIE